ncbi:MAG: hypothetical protein IT292_11820 [Deltaproteobacteria bacterium]|nr:hypothetical protein [Deltaproteobacteria bacterium]
MTFRTTNIQQTKNFVDQMYTQRLQIEGKRNEVASGLRVSMASEDPGRAGTITKFQNTMQRLTRHGERIATALSVLETQESILDSVQNIIMRTREIGSQAANGAVPKDVRAAMAQEVLQLRDQLVGLINTRSQGSYIYGGADDDDPPFDIADDVTGGYDIPGDPNLPASIRYVFDAEEGTDVTKTIQVTDSDAVRLNTSASIFENAVAAIERLGRSLAGYKTEPDAPTLPDGTGDAYVFPDEYTVQTHDILECLDLLESASVNDIEIERTSVGSRNNRLYQSRDILELIKLNTEKARSAIQDTDIFSVASELSGMELSLQALLLSGARINDMTILNYI